MFFSLLKNELNKLILRKRNLFFLLITILTLVTFCIASNNQDATHANWKKELVQQNDSYSKQMDSQNKELNEVYINKIKENEMLIKENINPFDKNQYSFIEDSTSIFLLISLFSLIISSASITDEYNYNTIKNLKVSPNNSISFIFSKYLSCIILISTSILLIFTLSFLIGGMTYGFEGLNSRTAYSINSKTYIDYQIIYIFKIYISEIIVIIFMMALSFFVSTITRSPTISVLVGLLTLMFYSNIAKRIENSKFPEIDFFSGLTIKKLIINPNISENIIDITYCLLLLLVYIIIFLASSIYMFDRNKIN